MSATLSGCDVATHVIATILDNASNSTRLLWCASEGIRGEYVPSLFLREAVSSWSMDNLVNFQSKTTCAGSTSKISKKRKEKTFNYVAYTPMAASETHPVGYEAVWRMTENQA